MVSIRKSSSPNSARRPSISARQLSIELLPNQPIFRSTFLGTAIPTLVSPDHEQVNPFEQGIGIGLGKRGANTSVPDNDWPLVGKLENFGGEGCAACMALQGTVERRESVVAYKRHAVILPTRHQGSLCEVVGWGTAADRGGDALMEWERQGSLAMASSSASSSLSSSPAGTPTKEPLSPNMGQYLGSRFSTDSVVGAAPLPLSSARTPRLQNPVEKVDEE